MKIVDSNNITFFESDINEVFYLYNKLVGSPANVTEEDEIKYEQYLRKSFTGRLYIEIPISFKGIDYFNRPVYYSDDLNMYFGSLDTLYDYNTPKEEINAYIASNINELVFFGYTFNCEPDGNKINPKYKLKITI